MRSSPSQPISGQIDAVTGEVLSMQYNPGKDYYKGTTVTLTRGQPQVVARQYLQEQQPQKYVQLQLRDDMVMPFPSNNINLGYVFYWQRLVNSLGFREIAEIPYLIGTPFRDAGQISANKPNYVSLIYGLGLLTPDSAGNFRPQ